MRALNSIILYYRICRYFVTLRKGVYQQFSVHILLLIEVVLGVLF